MSSNFGSLGEFFPETEVKCRIKGCHNMIHISGDQAMHNLASGQNRDKMCDSCFELFNKLTDQEVPCSKPGCTGHWIWNRFQQLEAHVQGRGDVPPKGLCSKCLQESRTVSDIQVPCRIRGCKNTWTWSGRSQMESASGKPPHRLCESCFQKLKTLKDIVLPCRVRGCTHTYTWTTYQQLEHLAAGKKLENPPRRMCQECAEKYRTLKDIEQDCKISGCTNKWKFSAFEQLEQWVADKDREKPEIPSRMCKSCFDFYNAAKDIEQPCRNKGCSHTWTWTRSMQLGAKVHGHDKPPVRMCDDCQQKLKQMHDMEIPCMEQGCTGTWTYRAEDQLKDQLQGRPVPQKRCNACSEFLASHESLELSCKECGSAIIWTPQEQLLHSLGSSIKPEYCSACVAKQMQEIRPQEARPVRPDFRVVIPSVGAWNRNYRIQDWPERVNSEVIRRAETVRSRIVCIGDEMTLSCENPAESWPVLLEEALVRKQECGEDGLQVINAGMAGCTTRLGIDRFLRDVAPYEPALVIFNFAFQDTNIDVRNLTGEVMAEHLQELARDFEEFLGLVRGLKEDQKVLCWVPNPICGGDQEISGLSPEERDMRVRFYESNIRQLRQLCSVHQVPLMDGRALFDVGGSRGAMKWMKDCFMPNEIGAKNISSWMQAAIQSNNLL